MLTCFQENGLPSFCESDIEARLERFWDAYTWEVVRYTLATPAKLEIRYVMLIGPYAFTLMISS